MKVTKDTLATDLRENLGFSKTQSGRLVAMLFEIISKSLESGEDVLISGFGKFSIKDKRQRRGRNPATGDELVLDARRVVTFKCSKVLRAELEKRPAGRARGARAATG